MNEGFDFRNEVEKRKIPDEVKAAARAELADAENAVHALYAAAYRIKSLLETEPLREDLKRELEHVAAQIPLALEKEKTARARCRAVEAI